MVSQTVENQNLSSEAVSEYEASMIAKAEGANEASLVKDSDQFTEPSTQQEAPLLAGKYKTLEDLEKGYKELESKLGMQQKEPDVKKDTTPTTEEAKNTVEKVGLDFTKLTEEFSANGVLSEATYNELSAKGIDKATVDTYIAGQQALAEQTTNKLKALAGGEAEYDTMISWAKDVLSDTEKTAFNKTLSDPLTAEFAIQGLYARYRASAEPNYIEGSSSIKSSGAYNSRAEMIRDMSSPLYKKDPAFRKQVEMKVSKSKF